MGLFAAPDFEQEGRRSGGRPGWFLLISGPPVEQTAGIQPACRSKDPDTQLLTGNWLLTQKTYFITNCTTRGSLTVLVMVPNAVLWMFACGGPKFG